MLEVEGTLLGKMCNSLTTGPFVKHLIWSLTIVSRYIYWFKGVCFGLE